MQASLNSIHAQYLSTLKIKHSLTSDSVKKVIADIIKKIITVAVFILFSPITVPIIAIAGIGHGIACLSQKIRHSDLMEEMKNTKEEEEKIVYEALKKVFHRHDKKDVFAGISYTVVLNQCIEEKYKRHLLRLAIIAEVNFNDARMAIYRLKSLEDFKTYALNVLLLSEDQWCKIQSTVSDETSPWREQKNRRAERRFNNIYRELAGIFVKSPKNYRQANKNIIDLLRKALQSDLYQMKKEGFSDQRVTCLHALSVAMWTDVKPLSLYQKIGASICKKIPLQEGKPATLLQLFKGSQKVAAEEFPHLGTFYSKLKYVFKYPKHLISSLASLGGIPAFIAGLFGRGTYDSHRNLSNHSFLQSVATILVNRQDPVKLYNVYGGSPTQGDSTINPEFEAVLQAAETNLLYPEFSIAGSPHGIFYANLQDIDSHNSESSRSKALMLLNSKYPCSFFGISLAKDSSFYRGAAAEKKGVTPHWPGAKIFGEQMLDQLMDPSSFTLEGRRCKGNGFYFPIQTVSKEYYSKEFTRIIENATLHFSKHPEASGKKALKLRAAYQEYVYQMIEIVVESAFANVLVQQKVKNPIVMSQRACKENVDRGGAENAKNLYINLDENYPDFSELFIGLIHSRSLSASRRVVLPSRVKHLKAFMKYVTPSDFKKSSEVLLSNLGLDGISQFELAGISH